MTTATHTKLTARKMSSVSEVLRFLSREAYDDINQYCLNNAAGAAQPSTGLVKLYKYKTVECAPDVEPYVMAFLQFLKDHKCDFTDIERPPPCKRRVGGLLERQTTAGQ